MRLIGAASIVFVLAVAFALSGFAPATQAEQTAATSEPDVASVTGTDKRYSASTPLATSSCGPMCCECTKSFRRSIRQQRWQLA